MQNSAIIEEPELRRFARLAAPYLQGVAVGRQDPRAARDRPGSGLEFLDLRDYQAGDDIRHIDWRQTARRQHAVVRRFRDEAAADWTICIDCSASVGLRIRKWSMMVRLASALAYACLFSGHRVAMLLFSDRINNRCELGRGARHYSTLLNLLLAQDVDAMVKPATARMFVHARSGRETKPINQSNLALCRDYLSAKSNAFEFLDSLDDAALDSVTVTNPRGGKISLAIMFQQLIWEFNQHGGQIAYIRGLQKGLEHPGYSGGMLEAQAKDAG